MKNHKKLFKILLMILIIILSIYICFFRLNKVKLIKIAEIHSTQDLHDGGWFPVYNDNNPLIKEYNISIPKNVDLKKLI